MLKNFKQKIRKNFEIFALVFLIFLTALSTTFYNYKKNSDAEAYNDFIDNIYLKKTLSHFIENLEPKYNKIKHEIKSGETFDQILKNYSIDQKEINSHVKMIEEENQISNKDLRMMELRNWIEYLNEN